MLYKIIISSPNDLHNGFTFQGTISESSHRVDKTANSHIEPNSKHLHQKEEICSFSGKKDEKSLLPAPFEDDVDVSTSGDNMTKVCSLFLIIY